MARRKKPGKKILTKILNESIFNPDEIGPLTTILNIGDPSYCETRAIELIGEAKIAMQKRRHYGPKPNLEDFIIDPVKDCVDHYTRCMTQAISLLAMARAMRQFDEEIIKKI
jgi:hypothetical protein